jgi:hypothetical protein
MQPVAEQPLRFAPDEELTCALDALLIRYSMGTVIDATWEAGARLHPGR